MATPVPDVLFPGNGATYSFLPQQQPNPQADWILHHIMTSLTNVNRMIAMKKAYALLGGWEAWLQVEIALWLEANVASTTQVEREKPVYNPSGEIDLWIMANGNKYGIELKCRTAKTPTWFTDISKSLPARFRDDAVKVSTKVQASFAQNASLYALAITGDPRDIAHTVAKDGGPQNLNKTTFISTYKPAFRWCYLYRNLSDTLEQDFTRVMNQATQGQIPIFENLYLIWYKKQ